MSTRDDDYTTNADAFDAGFEAGKASMQEKPSLTMDQIRKMTPAEIAARKPEVDAAIRADRARSAAR